MGESKSISFDSSLIKLDAMTEAKLKENNFKITRRMKLVGAIRSASCKFEQLEALVVRGKNVARSNMCEWCTRVIKGVKRLNEAKGYIVPIMMDTEGSGIHGGDLDSTSAKVEDGDAPLPKYTVNPNYDGFAEDMRVRDELLVDGEMIRFVVIKRIGPNVCTDPRLSLPLANSTFWKDGRMGVLQLK